jgi:glucose-1-phosphate cytidylyltransferase
MEQLAAEGELKAFTHDGFWQAMDTLRDRQYLEELWRSGKAPWRCRVDNSHESRILVG